MFDRDQDASNGDTAIAVDVPIVIVGELEGSS